ncbi:zf-HC2 domain-containing protein [Alloiococcus sp. CFN-8]|uniref:zf-HC2 domain-containing protein n=1 Tax=Alloiococcus sp. CFN-8 TaxID=3416081 RepID=UPI003CEEDB84
MSKITCSIIEDLLPLYKEELLSEDSKALVEEHLQECTRCHAYLKELSSPVDLVDGHRSYPEELLKNSDKAPILAIRRKLQQKKYITIACSVIIAVIFMLITYINLTAPILLPYNDELITFNKLDNGAIIANLSPVVAGYELEPFTYGSSEYNKANYYHISLWTNRLREYFPKDVGESFIINKSEKGDYTPVRGILYQGPEIEGESNGAQVIYGGGFPDGSQVAVLPRLVLNMYFGLALFLTLMGSIITFILRRRLKARAIALKITFLPVTYILSFLLVKGTSGASHTIIKDLSSILLLMFPIYFLMQLALKLLEYKKLKST